MIEIDDNSHEEKERYDAKRDKYLESFGLTVIHVYDQDVKHTLDGLMKMLSSHPKLRTIPDEKIFRGKN